MLHRMLYIFFACRVPVVLHMPVSAPQSIECTRPCDFSQNLVPLMEEDLGGLGVSRP